MKKLYILLMAGLISSCSDLTDVENNIPEVTTGDVVDVGTRQATIAYTGTINQDYYYLELSPSYNFQVSTTIKTVHPTGDQWKATGLLPGTTYYYRQCATDGLTTVNGAVKEFTTLPLVNINSINLHPWNELDALESLSADPGLGLFYSEAVSKNDYSGLSNFTITYDNGQWVMPSDLEPSEGQFLFYAYAPYNPQAKDKTRIPVSTVKQNIDYLCGRSTMVTAKQCNADITMRHALARIIFHVTKHPDNNMEVSVNQYAISRGWNSGLYFPIEGYLDLVNDTIGDQRHNEHLSRTMNATTEITSAPTDMELYVIPFDFMDSQLDFQLSNENSYTLFRTSVPASSWKAGYQYEYPVTVRRNGLEIGDVIITPWTENNEKSIIIKN